MKKISDFLKEELYATPMNTTGMANPAMPADTTVPTNISDNIGSGDIPSFFRSKRRTKRKKKRNRIIEKLVITHYKPYSCAPQTKTELKEIIAGRLEKDSNADLNDIDVSNIKDMSELFFRLDPHNIDISQWDVSNVKNMSNMFSNCYQFNSDLSSWDVSNVENMNCMFWNCTKFNSDLSSWDVSKVKYMRLVFVGCDSLKKLPEWYFLQKMNDKR